MSPTTLRWLQELDQLGWETPPGFNYYESIGEVVCKKAAIEHILGARLTLDTNVQDASFFTELASLDPRCFDPVKGGAIIQVIAVRFSAFDRMVTVFGTELEKWQDKLPTLYEFLEKQNYHVVSNELLQEPYEGAERRATETWTWFTRFFDYL